MTDLFPVLEADRLGEALRSLEGHGVVASAAMVASESGFVQTASRGTPSALVGMGVAMLLKAREVILGEDCICKVCSGKLAGIEAALGALGLPREQWGDARRALN